MAERQTLRGTRIGTPGPEPAKPRVPDTAQPSVHLAGPGPQPKLSTRIADHLRDRILSGDLQPGSRLPAESELALEMGVSRTAVRDAIRALASLGLVTVRQGHGISVAPPSDAAFAEALTLMLVRSDLTVGDLIVARTQIEAEICSAAADRATDAQIDRLADATDVFRAAVKRRRWGEVELAHTDAHLSLLAATGYPAFELMLRPMEQILMLSSRPPQRTNARLWEVSSHTAIVDAARARDRAALREAILAHYRVMDTVEYEAQRTTLVREAPGVREFLAQMLYTTRAPVLSELVSGAAAAGFGRPAGALPRAQPRRVRSR
jgi:GntR family transcriptional repressor for pyruvate dehydrogenase complex